MRASLRLKRTLATAATGALVLGLMPVAAFADDPEVVDFSDVCEGAEESAFEDRGSTHAAAIDCMLAYGVTDGQTATDFGTSTFIPRQQFASLVARFAGTADPDLEVDTSDAGFTDVTSATHGPNVNALANFDPPILRGQTETIFNPLGNLTRGAAASVLVRAHEALGVTFDDVDLDDSPFEDLGATHGEAVLQLYEAGIIQGQSDTVYGYSEFIQRGAIATLLARSAQVLDNADLWGADPLVEDPVLGDFPVTADETQVPQGTDITVTAEVDDAEEVTIWLLDADSTTPTEDTVLFPADDDGDFDRVDAAAGIDIISIDGTSISATQSRTVSDIDGGEVEFVVRSNASDTERFVVLVAETDEAPELDDNVIEERFGVEYITQQDVAGIALVDADRADVTVFGLGGDPSIRPEEETVNVTAILFDRVPDITDADDIADANVPVGAELSYAVVDETDIDAPDVNESPGAAPAGSIVQSGTVDVVDGVASFSFEGGEDGVTYTILTEWEGVEDGPYDGKDANNFGDATPVDASAHGRILFADDEPIATTASVVDGDEQALEIGDTSRVSVEVLDQFGNPVSGITVQFNERYDGIGVDNAFATETRVTGNNGIATLAFSSDVSTQTTVTASVPEDDNTVDDGIDDTGVDDNDVDVIWFVVVDEDATATEATIFASDTESTTVWASGTVGTGDADALEYSGDEGNVKEGDRAFFAFDYSVADVYFNSEGQPTGQSGFEEGFPEDTSLWTFGLTDEDEDNRFSLNVLGNGNG